MDDADRYVDEFGRPLPHWEPTEPNARHHHKTFEGAAKAALDALLASRHPFIDSLADVWPALFPNLPVRPGRYEDGKIFLYVPNAPLLFSMRPKLREIRRQILSLPNAPKKIDLRLEIHKEEVRGKR